MRLVAVFSGMIGATLFGIFFTPIYYVLLQRLQDYGAQAALAKPAGSKAG